MSGGKACIQVAAHRGFVEIVKLLIKAANVVADKENAEAAEPALVDHSAPSTSAAATNSSTMIVRNVQGMNCNDKEPIEELMLIAYQRRMLQKVWISHLDQITTK
ncbi:hypothetical protein EVAR_101502_1 [Eumeta japonica]|uniref:Uncharacterized protein n=1 Tax=Eumeta variegata TaxID=151549 RepID=A0A4C1T584_EUMVA|nr:hypothetical protein EVAR_101502_1 [Eumeta japonica]